MMNSTRVKDLKDLTNTIRKGIDLEEFTRMKKLRLFKVDTYKLNVDKMSHEWDYRKSEEWNLAMTDKCNMSIAKVIGEFEVLLEDLEMQAMQIAMSVQSGVRQEIVEEVYRILVTAGVERNEMLAAMESILNIVTQKRKLKFTRTLSLPANP